MKKVFNEILGVHIEVPDNPRIVSLAPSITDILYQIGVWEYVVGVSIYCNIPEEAKEKPRVGAYLKVMYNRLDELKPDIIFTTTGAQRNITFELFKKGYNVYTLPLPTSIYGILDNMIEVAHIFGKTDLAVEKAGRYLQKLSEISGKVSGRVYYEIDLGGPITAGRISYIHTALRHIGLENIYGEYDEPWLQPDPEYVKEKDPEIILYEVKPNEEPDKDKVINMFLDRGWSQVSAIKNDRVYVLKSDSLAHYGPTLFDTLSSLVDTLLKS